ncbi:MAG: YdbH domain-containing protein [Phycisphaeraceae bacterium]
MRKLARWFRRGVLLAGLALAGMAGLYVWGLPWLAQRQVRAALAEAGFDQATFTLDAATWRELRLSGLQLDPAGRATAGEVVARYQPAELLRHGRLRSLILRQVAWQVDLDDPHALAPFDQLAEGDPFDPARFPAAFVAVRDSEVTLHERGRTWAVPIMLTLTHHADRLRVRGLAEPMKPGSRSPLLEQPIALDGTWHRRAGRRGGEVGFRLTGLPLRDGEPLADVLAEYAGSRVTGAAGVAVRVALGPSGFEPHVTVALHDAEVTVGDGLLRFTGVQARFAFDRLAPLRSEGGQQLTWQTLEAGDFDFANGLVAFTIEQPDAILVERLQVHTGDGGQFQAHSFRIDPQAVDTRVDLFIEHVELERWLALVSFDRMQGQGRLSGRLPLRIRTQPSLRVGVGQGYLQAEPGGVVRLLDAAAAQDVLSEHGGPGGSMDLPAQIQDRVVEALRDFQFDALRFDFLEDDVTDQPYMRVYTKGRGRSGDRQEIGGLTVNVRNMDDLLNLAVATKLGLEGTGDRLRLNERDASGPARLGISQVPGTSAPTGSSY